MRCHSILSIIVPFARSGGAKIVKINRTVDDFGKKKKNTRSPTAVKRSLDLHKTVGKYSLPL